jgi:putative ABC transport system substrate-binding protein
MKRRVVALLIALPLLSPIPLRAADPAIPVIGFLSGQSEARVMALRKPLVTLFREGLATAGIVEGRDAAIAYRWAEEHADRLPALAAELVQMHASVIVVTGGLPAVQAAKAVTATTPVVFLATGDPVKEGLIESLSRPPPNLTGVTLISGELAPKQIELLNEVVPKSTIIVLLYHPREFLADELSRTMAQAATLGRQIAAVPAAGTEGLDAAFAKILDLHAGGIVCGPGTGFVNRALIVEFAARHAIPTIYPFGNAATEGGLMSYGADLGALMQQAAGYVDKILKGARPEDLPVQQPAKFEFVINLKTAQALGLEIPPVLRARADEMIE